MIGVPDEKWGERLKAFVVITADEAFSIDQVISFSEARLAKYKVPKEFEIIPQLPRNASGKLLKAALRERRQLSLNN